MTFSGLWVRKGQWLGDRYLDNVAVNSISPFLTTNTNSAPKPFPLVASQGISFQGAVILGEGFILQADEAEALFRQNPSNRDVIWPYLTGQIVNSSPTHFGDEWAINFRDWPLSHETAPDGYSGPVAADFPECLKIVRLRVKPEREIKSQEMANAPWWQYWRARTDLYRRLEKLSRWMLIATAATKYVAFGVVSNKAVFSHSLNIIASDDFQIFAVLHSNFHELWARAYSSTNLSLLRYTPNDCLLTFPFPQKSASARIIGESYFTARQEIMGARQEGLTKIPRPR